MSVKFHNLNRGVSLIEIILALALFSVVVTSIIRVQWDIDMLSVSNKKAIVAQNWSNFSLMKILNGELPVVPFNNEKWGTRHDMAMLPFSKCESVVALNSSWFSGWKATSTVYASLLQPNIAEIERNGGDCGGHPKRFSENGITLLRTIDVGFPVISVDIFENKILTGLRSLNSNDPDLALISLDANNTQLVDLGSGINKVDMSRYGKFAAHHSVMGQLVSLDFLEDNLAITATSTLPNVAGQRPEAVSLATYDSRVYVGTKRTAGHEFHVYDADQSPSWLGSMEMNHNVNDIEVKGDFAFLATSGNIRDMIVLDITNPSRITQVTTVDLLGNEDGKTLYVAGDLIFLGRYKATAPNHPELNVLRATFENGGIVVNFVASASTGSDVNDIVYAGGFVYTATSNPQKEIQIFKLDGKPLALIPVGYFDLPSPATSIDFENDLLVISSGEGVYVYNQHE